MTGDSPVAWMSGSKGTCHAQLLEHLGRHRKCLPVDHSGTGVVSGGRSVVIVYEETVSELSEPAEGPPRLPDDDGLADDLLPAVPSVPRIALAARGVRHVCRLLHEPRWLHRVGDQTGPSPAAGQPFRRRHGRQL